jgi:hypothetical protein
MVGSIHAYYLMLAPAAFSRERAICSRWRVSSDTRPLNGRRGTSLLAGKVSFQLARHVPHWLEGFPFSRWGTCTSSTGRASFQSMRYMYLAGWKETLPVNEVHVPCWLEGNPSSWQGTCTLSTGRFAYMYLARWKISLPVKQVHVPQAVNGLGRPWATHAPTGLGAGLDRKWWKIAQVWPTKFMGRVWAGFPGCGPAQRPMKSPSYSEYHQN